MYCTGRQLDVNSHLGCRSSVHSSKGLCGWLYGVKGLRSVSSEGSECLQFAPAGLIARSRREDTHSHMLSKNWHSFSVSGHEGGYREFLAMGIFLRSSLRDHFCCRFVRHITAQHSGAGAGAAGPSGTQEGWTTQQNPRPGRLPGCIDLQCKGQHVFCYAPFFFPQAVFVRSSSTWGKILNFRY